MDTAREPLERQNGMREGELRMRKLWSSLPPAGRKTALTQTWTEQPTTRGLKRMEEKVCARVSVCERGYDS